MDILQTVADISKTAGNSYLEAGREKGKKIAGYFCHVPVEIIHAAGMIPYRIYIFPR
jgi:benzoyl-CoA reductase/2-hydroxyglutaryl-CoA dehydratase subunit BcrC/BadD/HgdB